MNFLESIIEEIKRDSSGVLFLHDWIGDEERTVSQDGAEARANVCLHTKQPDGKEGCPLNSHPNWWARWVRDPIANAIRKELEIKEKMKLRLAEEEHLHMCSACGCNLRLKPWAPTKHIKKHTRPQDLAKMPHYCWIRKEIM